MPPKLALLLCIGFVFWLLRHDYQRRDRVSHAIWVPLLWALIIGSRGISEWFVTGPRIESEGAGDTSMVDRLTYLVLTIAGVLILIKRQVRTLPLLGRNQWLVLFYVYLGLSVLWSDFQFISLKRWVKEVGNLVMILVVLTERDPAEAARTLFRRCAYLLIPFSVLFIKYFPELGRVYNVWTWEPKYVGVTTNKNQLGSLVLVCSLFLIWDLFRIYDRKSKDRKDWIGPILLLLLGAYLLRVADSATSTACTVIGAGLLLFVRSDAFRRMLPNAGVCAISAAILLVLLNWFFGIYDVFFQTLGRDGTLTGRTDIWKHVLSVDFNPLLGTGFYSFWLGEGSRVLAEENYRGLTQAHNGFLEAYLNSGLIGVLLLIAVIICAYRGLKQDALKGIGYAPVILIVLIIGVVHNFSEASINRLTLVWLAMLLSLTRPPRLAEATLPSTLWPEDQSAVDLGLRSARPLSQG